MDLIFEVNKQTLLRKDEEKPTEKSQEYLKCKFEFSEDWKEINKYAIFSNPNYDREVEIINNECIVPYEVIVYPFFTISVKGISNDNIVLITTNEEYISLQKTGKNNGTITNHPNDSYENKIQNSFSNGLLNYSQEDGILTLNLVRNNGETISLDVDLPIEKLLKDVKYDSEKETLILIFENNKEVEIPLKLSTVYSADEETLTLENNTFKIKKSFLDDLEEEFISKETIVYVDELPTNIVDIQNSIYGLSQKKYELYMGSINLSQTANVPVVTIKEESEIDTSYMHVAYIEKTDTPYIVSDGNYINLGSEYVYNGLFDDTSSFTNENQYYMLKLPISISYYIYHNNKWYKIIDEEKVQKIIGELNSNLTSQMEGLYSNVQQNFVPINSTEATYIHRGNTTYKVSDTFGMSNSQISKDNYIYDFYINDNGFETIENNSTKKGEFDIYTDGPALIARFTDNDYNTTSKGGSSYLYLTPVAMNFTGKIYENFHRVATKDEVNSIIEEKTKIINITYNLISEVITCDYDFANNVPNQALLEVIDGDDHIYYVGNKEEILNNNVGEDDHTARNLTYYFKGFGKIVIYQNDININEVTYTVYEDTPAVNFTIYASDWYALSNNEPFTVCNEYLVNQKYKNTDIIEAVFNNKVLQAKYGIILNSIEETETATLLYFYAITQPTEDITGEVVVYG